MYCKPGDRMLYDLKYTQNEEEERRVRVRKIDTKEPSAFWNRVPVYDEREKIQLGFQKVLPPMITVSNFGTGEPITFIFGSVLDRNEIKDFTSFVFSISNCDSDRTPLYELKALRTSMPSIRLNAGICSFTMDGNTKIMLIGGNRGLNKIESEERAKKSLYSTCLLFDVTSQRFEKDFKLSLECGKDSVTAIVVDNYVYSLFGRKARAPEPEISPFAEQQSGSISKNAPKYEYCFEIDRWRIGSKEKEFESIKLRFAEGIEKCLNPLIFPTSDNSKLIISGGVNSKQIALDQVLQLDINQILQSEESKIPEVDSLEISKLRNEAGDVVLLSKAVSFPNNNYLLSDEWDSLKPETSLATVGISSTGFPWLLKTNLKASLFVQNAIL